jgi:glycosyltransferase involved in cell wall biosynthesis
MDKKALSVAILGSRGIPNRYGGFEVCAEELGTRLVSRGHRVVVYTMNDHPVKDLYWQGIQRVMKPNPENIFGSFGQFIYDFHCNRHSRNEIFDIVLHLGYTSDSVWYWLWKKNTFHIVNMDGQEWKRSKYSKAVRRFLKFAERLATLRSSWLVADSKAIESYLVDKYRLPVRYIPYGAVIPQGFLPDEVIRLGLAPHQYDLIIARMEPENNIEMAIEAKLRSEDRIPLVIVSNDNAYKHSLVHKYEGHELIRFSEAIYDSERINSLRHFSRLYVHGHSVGGTNPSLLEAMACGCRIVSHKNHYNEHVLGEDAFYYSDQYGLTALFNDFDAGNYAGLVTRNLDMIRQEYNWDAVADAYEKLFFDAAGIT